MQSPTLNILPTSPFPPSCWGDSKKVKKSVHKMSLINSWLYRIEIKLFFLFFKTFLKTKNLGKIDLFSTIKCKDLKSRILGMNIQTLFVLYHNNPFAVSTPDIIHILSRKLMAEFNDKKIRVACLAGEYIERNWNFIIVARPFPLPFLFSFLHHSCFFPFIKNSLSSALTPFSIHLFLHCPRELQMHIQQIRCACDS